MSSNFTVIIEKEGAWYVARTAELELARQGKSVDEAIANLKEALTLWLRHADEEELAVL